MIIQVGHSRDFDYERDLYEPIKGSQVFSEHTWIFPHDTQKVNSIETLKQIDIFLAEVSLPSTGLGIELAYANIYGKRIVCVYKRGMVVSSSLPLVTEEFIEYDTVDELLTHIKF